MNVLRGRTLSRRTVLRAAGGALGLPLLDAMLPGAQAAPPAEPLRLLYVYAPNGVVPSSWKLAEEGPLGELTPGLAPLAAHKQDLLVLSGLTLDTARANGDGPGDHARAAGAYLTCTQPYKGDGTRLAVGPSADQLAARALGPRTRVPSIEMGLEGGRIGGQCDSGYPCAYSNHVSWSDASTPRPKETEPQRLFDRLFRDGPPGETPEQRDARLAGRASLLDHLREETRRLRSTLGAEDGARLDGYLESVRAVERRLERLRERGGARVDPSLRPGEPEDREERALAFFELTVLAFQSDATRVGTLMLGNEGSGHVYRELGLDEGHHSLTHHRGDETKVAAVKRIDRRLTELFALLLDRLAAAPAGEGRLLDHCMVLYGSGVADGDRHSHHDLPLVLAGRGGGTLATGRHVRYPRETPLADLHLALLERLGVTAARLGDGAAPLGGLA